MHHSHTEFTFNYFVSFLAFLRILNGYRSQITSHHMKTFSTQDYKLKACRKNEYQLTATITGNEKNYSFYTWSVSLSFPVGYKNLDPTGLEPARKALRVFIQSRTFLNRF